MTTTATIEQILEDYGRKVETEIQKNLDATHRASGALSKSIRFKVFTFGTVTTFELYLDDYYKFIDEGRKPTRSGGTWKGWSQPSLRRSILFWLQYKGIQGKVRTSKKGKMSDLQMQRASAFLIARKIHQKGFKGDRFFSKVFDEGAVGDPKLLEAQIAELLGISVKVEIENVSNENQTEL